jgi:hypothetical protein
MTTDRNRDKHSRVGFAARVAAVVLIGATAVIGTLDAVGTIDVGNLAADVVAAPSGNGTPAPAGTAPAGEPVAKPSGTASPGASTPAAAKPKWVQPAPFVQPFARAPRAAPRRPGARKANPVMPKGFDGCDHSYGKTQQCVPWSFPPGVTDKCAWLAAHGLKAFTIKTTDRHTLDTTKDGIACGPGDKP